MRRALFLLLLGVGVPLSAQPPELVTRLKAEPVADVTSFWPFKLDPALQELRDGLPSTTEAGDRVFAGVLEVLEESDLDARIVLVEPAVGEPHLYVDADLDGALAAEERFAFGKVPGVETPAVLLRFHVNTTGLPYYPVVVTFAPPEKEGAQDGSRRLLRSDVFYLQGTIEVAGREILVRYPVYPFTGKVDLRKGRLGMDLDGDGVIEPGLSAGETDRDKGQGVIFRLGGLYLSTARVDPAAGLAILRFHAPSEARSFDLRPGSRLPDFPFTDVDGRQRRLSELHGKIVLLDFWGTWCVPCVEELPVLRKAFTDYRDRGFAIVGMNARDDLARLQAFVAEKDVPWLHATADSVEDVMEHGFRVRAFPTKILLDREGRILSVGDPGQPPLKGEDLLKTVEAVVSPHPVKEYVGQLEGEPIPELQSGALLRLDPAPRDVLDTLPAPPTAGDRVSAGAFQMRYGGKEVRVVLVEPPGGKPYVYVDVDLDGNLSAAERFAFGEVPDVKDPAVIVKLPLGKSFFPVLLRPDTRPYPEEEPRRLIRSAVAYVEGTVQFGLRELLVRYRIDPRTGEVSLNGSTGMDLDDDGVIDRGLSAGEVGVDMGGGRPMFRIGSTYFSTCSVDSATGRIVIQTRPASDYKRFDLRPGVEMADFAFTDLDGRQRRLSELRGKVVLLDFWGTWCGPCLQELPQLRKLYETYRDQGLVILGMDFDDDLETLKKVVAEQDAPWLHATAESVRSTIENGFQVSVFPTHMLLDREGRIVSVGDPGQPPLKKEDLLATVGEVVSRKPPVEYAGRLESEPVPRPVPGMPEKLEPASPEIVAALPVRPSPGESVHAARLRVFRRTKLDAQVILVEPLHGIPFLYADVDLDGKLSAGERFELEERPDLGEGRRAALLRFKVPGGRFPTYPILLRWEAAKAKEEPRLLFRSHFAFVEGTVPVEGREVKVRYPVSQETADVDLQLGELGMDVDGNGEIDRKLAAGEVQVTDGETTPAIFRLGDLYLSTKSVDAAAGRVVLRTHAPAEYKRFDLRPGSPVPDFEFTDLAGRPRRLSELRGKVVLLDFWGVWCGTCVAELPHLRKTWEAYRDQGFEILGMDWGDKPGEHRKFVEEQKLPWVHATAVSVEDVVRKGFGIWRFPTKVLLDREGKILEVQEGDGTEEDLMKMVAAALSGEAEEKAR